MKNFKKIFALITVICMLASTMTVVFADDVTYSFKYDYDDANNTATVTGFEKAPTAKTDIVIPATVEKDGKTYNVTTIGDDALRSDKIKAVTFGKDGNGDYQITTLGSQCFANASITSIVMPDTITSILGVNNFYNCNSLASVTLSNNIDSSLTKSIGMFTDCKALKEVHLPTGSKFTKIPSKMFRGCQLDKLYVPDNVKECASDAFIVNGYTTWVNEVYGTSSNAVVQSIANDIKAEDGTATKQYATNFDTYDLGNGTCAVTGVKSGTSLAGAIYMPEELNGKRVVAMMYDEGRYPFDSNQKDSAGRAKVTNTNAPQLIFNESNLTEFHMADTVEHIMYRKASDYASNYVAVNADGSVKCEDPVNDETSTHYWYLFYGCSKLEKLHLSNNLKGRVRGLLRTANKLTEIEIPAGVTNISHCFRSQTTLKSIRFAPNSQLTKIESDTFKDTTGLEELVLPTQSAITTCKPNLNGTNTNLAIITTEANAAESSAVKTFANSKNIKVYTNLDANIIADATGDTTGVTVTLRSRGLGYNAMPAGCKFVYAVYDANGSLAKVDIKGQTDLDFTTSLVKTVDKNIGITVDAGQTVKVYAWTDLDNLVPVAQPAK